MTMWNYRQLPYPLLAPWTDDYGDAAFVASAPSAVLDNGKQINLAVKYNLTSQVLREMVSKGEAQYVGVITCAKTFARNAYQTKNEDFIQSLDAADYAGELSLRPYLVATQQTQGFVSKEFAEELRRYKPDGFDIAPGSILAVSHAINVDLGEGVSLYSVIDLVADQKVEDGSFTIDLDENRIKIYVSPEDKKHIEALRRRGEMSQEQSVLFPALYLHAVTEALRNLRDYDDKNWASTLKKGLERHKIDVDDESLKVRALMHAQTLLENPLGRFLTAFGNIEEALFLYMLKQEPRTHGYALGTKYSALLGNPSEDPLMQVPVYELE